MTNFEKIKNMTKDEMIEFLFDIADEEHDYFNDGWCMNKCEHRHKTTKTRFGTCKLGEGKCAYLDNKLVIEKWLDMEV